MVDRIRDAKTSAKFPEEFDIKVNASDYHQGIEVGYNWKNNSGYKLMDLYILVARDRGRESKRGEKDEACNRQRKDQAV